MNSFYEYFSDNLTPDEMDELLQVFEWGSVDIYAEDISEEEYPF